MSEEAGLALSSNCDAVCGGSFLVPHDLFFSFLVEFVPVRPELYARCCLCHSRHIRD